MREAIARRGKMRGVSVEPPESDEDLPGTWASLGLPGIVDVHVHAMPDRLQAKVWEYVDEAGPLLGREWPITIYRQDLATRTATLRSFGVRAFPSLPYPHKPGMAPGLNEWAAQFARETPGCLQTGDAVRPHQVAAIVELDLGKDWLRAVLHDNAVGLWPQIE